MTPRQRGVSVPAPLLFLGAGFSSYIGAALAVGLFATAGALTVGWARLLVSAIVLVLLVRPWQLHWTRRSLGIAVLFGLLLGAMNLLFYVAIDHLPLGAAVAIEFTGPVAVAVVAARGRWDWRRVLAPLLAAGGVVAIGFAGVDWSEVGPDSGTGVLFALAAGAAWAGYIVVGRRIAARGGTAGGGAAGAGVAAVDPIAGDAADSGNDDADLGNDDAERARPAVSSLRRGMASLALGMSSAAIGYAWVGVPGALPLVADARTIALVVALGVLSSVVPYALDQVAMRRLPTAAYALLNALLPATATLVGFLALRQLPSAWELGGVAAISVAVALATRRA